MDGGDVVINNSSSSTTETTHYSLWDSIFGKHNDELMNLEKKKKGFARVLGFIDADL